MGKLQVQALPPTNFITDPHVRAWADAMSSAWGTRNDGAGDKAERFVRVRDIGALAGDALVQILSGATSPGVIALTGDPIVDYSNAVTAVRQIVTGSAAYELIKTPIEQIAAPSQKVNDLVGRINESAAASLASIQAEAAARIAALAAQGTTFNGQINDLQTQINTIIAAGSSDTATILAALQDEQTARVNADSAEATSRSTLAAQMRGTYSGTDPTALTTGLVFNEHTARVSAVAAVASSVSSLSATVGSNTTAIANETTARTTAVSAVATSLTALTTRVGTAEGNIATELTTRASKDNSLAQAINTIWSNIGGAAALIQDGALAAVSPAAVSATKWQQVQAAVTDPNTGQVVAASIKQQLDAYVSKVDGTLNTTWAVRSNVNGVISGIELMTSGGAGTGAGSITSNFLVMADRLSLVSPSNNALQPVPFSVDSSGNAVFAGWVYAAGGSFGGALAAATGTFRGALSAATGTFSGSLTAQVVNTENLVGAAITNTYSVTASGTSVAVTVTIPAGSRAITVTGFLGAVSWVERSGGTSGSTVLFTPGQGPVQGSINSPLGSASGYSAIGQTFIDPPAGTYTFTVSRLLSGAQYTTINYLGPITVLVLLSKR